MDRDPFPREAYNPSASEIVFHVPHNWLELPAPSDDGAFYRRLVWPADRGSVCLDCRSYAAVTVFEMVKGLLGSE